MDLPADESIERIPVSAAQLRQGLGSLGRSPIAGGHDEAPLRRRKRAGPGGRHRREGIGRKHGRIVNQRETRRNKKRRLERFLSGGSGRHQASLGGSRGS